LFLEYIPYPTLASIVDSSENGLSEKKALNLLAKLVCGVEYIHKLCIAHHDLTPDNVLVDKITNTIKIIDFGLSISFETDNPRVLHGSGTPLFMSPEVLQNQIHNPMLTDIWSLGVVFYFMLTNAFPWSNYQKTKEELLHCILQQPPDVSNIPELVRSLILGMLIIEPEDRWNLSEIQLVITEYCHFKHHYKKRGKKEKKDLIVW